MELFQCYTRYQVIKKLAELGVVHDHTHQELLGHRCWYSGRVIKQSGIHIYFQDEYDQDLAYWTPIMDTLAVLDTPRPTRTTPAHIINSHPNLSI